MITVKVAPPVGRRPFGEWVGHSPIGGPARERTLREAESNRSQ